MCMSQSNYDPCDGSEQDDECLEVCIRTHVHVAICTYM